MRQTAHPRRRRDYGRGLSSGIVVLYVRRFLRIRCGRALRLLAEVWLSYDLMPPTMYQLPGNSWARM